jgi:hypothetical protein
MTTSTTLSIPQFRELVSRLNAEVACSHDRIRVELTVHSDGTVAVNGCTIRLGGASQ